MEQPKVFRIGIAMAGAVSAGAYTAGVMDYLLETLESWERAKRQNRALIEQGRAEEVDHSVPMHDVVIEVFGGASAGGMTSAIATLALFEGIPPVYEDGEAAAHNKLYDAWVNLNDRGHKEETLLQMMERSDIKKFVVPSLLNSQPIDQIADRAIQLTIHRTPDDPEWPSYISRGLELILTISSLRGIPIELNFGSQGSWSPEEVDQVPAHRMHMHKGIAHFTIDPEKGSREDHLLGVTIASEEEGGRHGTREEAELSRRVIIEAAKATGAFPMGLAPRVFEDIPHAYLKAHIIRTFENPNININWGRIPDYFDFTAVDGGTINNEPFEDVLRVLEERYAEDVDSGRVDPETQAKNYALIMIDPFPNFGKSESEDYQPAKGLMEVAAGVITAVRRQAMIKESELSRGFSGDYTRAMIFPVRRKELPDGSKEKMAYAIACGSLDGFGGFFSREFRVHDFFLGRRNCQSFLRKHFSLTSDADEEVSVYQQVQQSEQVLKNTIFQGWGPGHPAYDRFHYVKGNKVYLPIIPDMRITDAMSDDPKKNGTLPAPPFPSLSIKKLKKLRKPMRKRLHAIIMAQLRGLTGGKPKKEIPAREKRAQKDLHKLVTRHLGSSLPLRIGAYVLLIFLGLILVVISPLLLVAYSLLLTYLVRSVLSTIVSDFRKRELLEEEA